MVAERGAGNRFRCHQCDFNLHEYCGSCPFVLSSFMHPQPGGSKARPSPERARLRFQRCDFDLHPLCTQFPQHVRHVLHPTHQLTLQTSSAYGSCAVCSRVCSFWRYRCQACSFDIHLECVLSAASNIGAAPTSRSPPLPALPQSPPPPTLPPSPPPPHLQIVRAQNPVGMKLLGKIVFKLVANVTLGVLRYLVFGTGDFSYFN